MEEVTEKNIPEIKEEAIILPEKKKVIKSVGYNQHDMINDIIELHCPEGIEVDMTFSKGNFYNNGKVKMPKYKFDKFPQTPDTQQLKDRLPFEDGTIYSIMVDLPFVISSNGPSMSGDTKGQNIISKRFHYYTSPKELFNSYENILRECYRVLKQDGTLIFKTQDTISSSKNYLTHVWSINKAEEIGFYTKDLFVLCSKHRVNSGKIKKQQHARKHNSFFICFRKTDKYKKLYKFD